jgi:hypothetical protein
VPLRRPLPPLCGAGTLPSLPLSLLAFSLLPLLPLLAGACSAPRPSGPSSVLTSGEKLDCPAPIGKVPREDCSEVADDFGALSLSGALQLAGTARGSELRVEAIRAAAALSNSLKEQRIALCESYNKCGVRPADHAAKDQLLAGAMRSLIELWNKRQFSRPEEVARFREGVRAIDQRVNGGGAVSVSAPRSLRAEEALASVEGAGLSFKRAGGAVTVTSQGAGDRPALRSRPEALALSAGHHYRVRVKGSYAPAQPALIQPGDALTARLKFRAREAGELYVALRSLEDPESTESTTSWSLPANEGGAREVNLTADPQASGFYLGVGVRGAGAIELDDIELARQGKVLAAARAEATAEPAVKTDCPAIADKPLAGSKSLRCQGGNGDRVTIGMPAAFLSLSLRVPSGDRAALRTLSLDGGRSLDATVSEDAELVISLSGAGTATITAVEISELSP